MTTEQKAIAIEIIAELSRKGERIDGMTLARSFNKQNRTALDWHEFSNLLDQLQGKGILKYDYSHTCDGMTAYAFNK